MLWFDWHAMRHFEMVDFFKNGKPLPHRMHADFSQPLMIQDRQNVARDTMLYHQIVSAAKQPHKTRNADP